MAVIQTIRITDPLNCGSMSRCVTVKLSSQQLQDQAQGNSWAAFYKMHDGLALMKTHSSCFLRASINM